MKKALTSIELLVVLALIGILLGLIIPPLSTLIKKNTTGNIVKVEQEDTILRPIISPVFLFETNGVKVYRFYDRKVDTFGYFSIDGRIITR